MLLNICKIMVLITAGNNEAIKLVAINGHLDVVKYLQDIRAYIDDADNRVN
jgi:hypothetical protein